MQPKGYKRLFSLLLSLVLVVSLFPLTALAEDTPGKGPIVFHEIYSGGGNSNAIYNQKYVVLKNIGAASVDIGGYTVWRASSSGAFNTNNGMYYTIPSNTVLPAGAYCFMYMQPGATGAPLPALASSSSLVVLPGAGTFNPSATAAKLALTTDAILPAGPASANVVDFIGYGNASQFYGTAAPTGENGKSFLRTAYNADNASDYAKVTPDVSYLTAAPAIPDPITSIPAGAVDISAALAASSGELTVVGQLVYRYGNYNTVNTAILQDVINGEIVALQVYNALSGFETGDILSVTGTRGAYGGVPQLGGTVTATKLYSAAPIAAQEFASFDDLLADKAALLSEWVLIKDVTLGSYVSSGNTNVTDKNDEEMPIYRAATYPAGVAAGDTVDLYACLSQYNGADQLRVGASTDYVVTSDTAAPVITVPASILSAEVGKDYAVSLDIADNVGVTEAKLTYTIGGGSATVDLVKNVSTGKYEGVIPGSAIVTGTAKIDVSVTARDAKNNTGTAAFEIPVADFPQVIEVVPAPNSATGAEKRPAVTVKFTNAGTDPSVTLVLNGGSAIAMPVADSGGAYTASHTPAADLADGKYAAKASITRQDGVKTDYEWTFTVGEPQYRLYFGQLHSHTAQYSDGTGTLKDAYDYVLSLPESENVDFLAVTDHSNYFDTSGELGDITDAAKGKKAADGRTLWQEAKDLTAQYNALPGDTVFLYGYEMTWSGGPGHMNTYNTEGFVSRNNATLNNKENNLGMQAYYNLLKTSAPNSISQFNHPGTTFGTFADFAYWSPAIDELVTMIEVGNGEGAVRSSAYWPSYEYYTLALDKGWHLAPTNNQDNHKGKWGNANTARNVILTDDFSEQGIYQAMRDMSMYATEDKNLEILYFVNDQPLGSILAGDPANVHIRADISDPDSADKINNVSVIVNGGVTAYSTAIQSNTGVVDVTLPNDYSYYYLRIDQADGDIAVTAPVWTGEVSKVGIHSVRTDALIPIKGEAMNITTSIYNDETSALTVDSIVYSLRVGQGAPAALATVPNPLTVAALTQGSTAFAFTPTSVGRQTLTVTVNATINGVARVFTQSLELNVFDNAELIDIAIDGGHSNFYVTGNYANSDVNFIELCARSGVRTQRLAAPITYEKIKDMKLVVLTVPFKSYGTALGDSLYTTAELAALKQYADSGGNLIVCSKSDRGNPAGADEKAHVITNGILSAIGAKARIADGIVVDNAKKLNESYRLSFADDENYNYNNPFLKNVKEKTSNAFSCYNGAPVIANGAAAMVKGYPTTWGANFTADFGGSASYVPVYDPAVDTIVVPMGEVDAMVSETLAGGGFLITSGSTFFSTFEVQVEMENAATLQNSNYQIVMNIIDALMPEPTVSPISAVHQAAEGVKFTVEGVVTSNASGYDQRTAFFDCIYIQDGTRGVNLFPVAGSFKVGDRVRVTGTTSSYNGERQLAVSDIEKIGDGTPLPPAAVTAAAAMSPANTGNLLKVTGAVTDLGYASDGTLDTILVTDATGTARVFIDGYIMPDYSGLNLLKKGDTIEAVGLGSITVDTSGEGSFIPRLRVRNRAEIRLLETPGTGGEEGGGTGGGGGSFSGGWKTITPATPIPENGVPGGVSIRGSFSSGAKLRVTDLPSSGKAGAALRMAALNHTVIGLQHLALSGRNSGSIQVIFRVGPDYEGATLTVLQYIEATGRIVSYTGEVVSGTLTIQVTGLGAFAVLSELVPLSAAPPKTGDGISGIGFGLILLALGAARLAAGRRRSRSK
ncbi:MAG TPA: CehA/McbA family metallohydrolase [Feifaniaceae bacterium]|nr:CehA/McbA family metallohydrolase [Feifaniaceae bacterium]